jgi:hypothetical protein
MRVLVISDIHSNCTALEAVLAGAGTVDEIWCLGDLVGYGPDPNAVVSLLRGLPHLTCLLGNHDVAVIGKMPFETFNGEARRSLVWTETQLSADNMEYLRTLPRSSKVRGDATLAHGSPRDRDARSAYAIYDTSAQSWTPQRASYNISEVQRRIRDANLPEKHALRLSEGW